MLHLTGGEELSPCSVESEAGGQREAGGLLGGSDVWAGERWLCPLRGARGGERWVDSRSGARIDRA